MKNKILILLSVIFLSLSLHSCVVDNPNYGYHYYHPVEHRGYWGHPSSYRNHGHHYGSRHNWERR